MGKCFKQHFERVAQKCRNFSYGDDLINVDATDLSEISYEGLV